MKTIRSAMTLLVLASLAGCVSSADKLDRVQTGMNRDQVLALLGPPDGMRSRGDVEYLTYYVASKSTGGEQPYMVRLVDRQVDAVGRFVQLDELEAVGGVRPRVGMGAILPARSFPDTAAQLRQLAALRERGELSEEEFRKARQELLAGR
ncbi:MAG: outer membrane protein assembly factor BamE [Verrucomicrobia bacterium]|nr:outer membrane protein assembly factor BamE [Verrucomicrobiota bacterium]